MARFYAGVCHGVFAIAEYDFIVLLLLLSWTLYFIAVDEFDSVAQ
jgi:hypothetical protein